MTDSTPAASKRFETPILDSLKPQHRDLVRAYVVMLDKFLAAERAGYVDTNKQLADTVNKLFTNPKIVAAIDELLSAQLEQLDAGRAALCTKYLNQSLAEITDVAMRVPYQNGYGKEVLG